MKDRQAMSRNATSLLMSELRFPEFRSDAAWGVAKLRDIAEFFKGKGLPKSALSASGQYACIHYGELFLEYPEVIATIRNRTSTRDDAFLSRANDVLMPTSDVTPRGLAKACCIKLDNVVLGGDILVIRTKKHEINGEFLARYIRHRETEVLRLVSGTTVFHLYPSAMGGLELAFPSIKEQQQIAECLSTLDELISAESQKLDALKAHKKGLMQQLFPREGETLPRLRFPEFQSAPEWEAKRLEELVSFQSGGTPSKANPAFWNGSVPWVSAKDMKQLFLGDAEDHISEAAVAEGAKLVPSGTLLMLVRGMTLLKDVPICVVRREMSFNQDVKALRQTDGVDGLFLALLLTGSKDRLLEMVTVAGHGTGKLDTDELKAMALMLPRPAEQQRIAACLSSLDELIAAQGNKLEALKTHKKGLMQQLFPLPAEA